MNAVLPSDAGTDVTRALRALTTAEILRGLTSPQFADPLVNLDWDSCFVGCALGGHVAIGEHPAYRELVAVGARFAFPAFRSLVRAEALRELAERGEPEVLVSITRALEKLGPARVAAGLAAFTDPAAPGNWGRCFLARAYGRPGALTRRAIWPLAALTLPLWGPTCLLVAFTPWEGEPVVSGLITLGDWYRARVLGLTRHELRMLTTLFDGPPPTRDALRDRARAWLELDPPVRRGTRVREVA